MSKMSRRTLIAATTSAGSVAAAAAIARQYGLIPPDHGGLYGPGETLTYATQRILTRHTLAREFTSAQISKKPFANSVGLLGKEFHQMQQAGFTDWRLTVDGLVAHPTSFSLADIRSFPTRTHITHLACEEGWSYIAQWTGAPLAHLLRLVGTRPRCALCRLPFHPTQLVGKHRHG